MNMREKISLGLFFYMLVVTDNDDDDDDDGIFMWG